MLNTLITLAADPANQDIVARTEHLPLLERLGVAALLGLGSWVTHAINPKDEDGETRYFLLGLVTLFLGLGAVLIVASVVFGS